MSSSVFDASCADGLGPNENESALTASSIESHEATDETNAAAAAAASSPLCTEVDGNLSTNTHKKKELVVNWRCFLTKAVRNGETVYKCKFCTFANEWGFVVRHVQLNHKRLKPSRRQRGVKGPSQIWTCDECNYRTPELQRMRRHHACHGASGTFKCEWCNYSSNKLIDVGKHAKWHNDVGKNFRCSSVEVQRPVPAKKAHSFVCPVCSKRCERASDLASHTRMHMDLRPFMCTKCGLRSNFKQSVKKHIRLQHDGDFSELMVELSPSEARDTIDAYRSTVSAAAIDQGKCTLPAELDTDVKRLGTLVEQQDGNASTPDEFLNSASNSCDNRRRDNMFKCKKCGFRTCVRKNMKSHVRNMHGITKSKASIIRVCLSKTQNAKKFRKYQKSDSRQMRVGGDGGDIKKFVCHVCSRACVSASKLRKHISIHTDLKPYKCSHCGLRCNFKENLKTHVRKVHGFENEEAYIVILSPTEAKTTVDDYNRSRVQTAAVHKSPHSATTAAAAAESGNGSLRGAAGRSEKHGNITDRAEDDEPCADDDRNRLRGSSASQQHHVCGVCSKTCESADDLQRHRVSHSDVKRFMCRLCGMRTNFKGNMTKHARNKHGADDASDLLIELPLIDDKETLDTCDSEKVNSTVEEGNGDLSSSKICTPEPLTKMHPSLCENGGNSSGSSQPDVAAHNKSDNSNNDLRRYKCSVCGYRSNFRTNVRKHLLNLHRVGNVPRYIVALSVSEAADTIDAYRLERDVKGGGRARPVSAAKSDGIGTRRPMTARKTRRVVSAAEQVTGISHPVDESGAAERDPVNGAAPEMTIDVSERKSTEDGGGTDVITTGSVDGSVPEVDEAVSYIGMDEVATVANLGRFMCSECDYRAFTPAGVYKHRQRHHPEARTITLTSDEAYRSYMATRSQLADQNGFRQTSGASVDKSRRVDLLPYVCGGCGRRTKSLKTMKRHIKDQHRGAAKVIRLSAEEAERSLAGYHAKFGSSSPSVHAEDGDATAASASSRRRGSRPAALPSCDRSTVTYDGQHLRRFACSHCPQRSNYRRTIAYHININHPESGATVRMLPEEEARATLKAYNSLVYSRDSSVKLNAGLPRKSSSATKSKKYAVPPSADVKLADDADADMGGGRHRKRSDVRLPESDAIGDSSFDASWSDACENPNAPFGYSIDGSYFVCNICPYRAVRLYHLESHQRMHVERPKCKLKCSYCPYFTSHPSFLKQHLLLHEGSPSTVTAASALEEIVGRTVVGSPSSGEKPSVFVCDHCPYMSKYRTKMISHKQLHRQRASAPFKCSLCPLWMADRRCVRRHMLVHEPDYAETWYRSAPSAERPVKLCVPDVEVEPEIIETTAIKLKLIANRCGSATAARGPTRRVGSSPSKPQKNESSVSGHPGLDGGSSVASGETSGASRSAGGSGACNSMDAVVASEERRTANRSTQLWRCDKCPYSASSIPYFKRHVFLHGRRLPYECIYCNYSVASYWRLTEHQRLHHVQNQNLLHSQSVSNLIFLPSRSHNPIAAGDPPEVYGERLKLYEDSGEFSAPTLPPFRCTRCPFTSDRRTEFRNHVRCHFARARHSCPFCNFGTAVSYVLLSHVLLHFSLPGSDTSSLSPNTRDCQPWKSLIVDIESFSMKYAEKSAVELPHQGAAAAGMLAKVALGEEPSVSGGSAGEPESCSDVPNSNGESLHVELPDRNSGEAEDDRQQINAVNALVSVPEQEGQQAVDAVSSDARGISGLPSSDNLDENSVAHVCQYCDRPFAFRHQLKKHEAGHLVGNCFSIAH